MQSLSLSLDLAMSYLSLGVSAGRVLGREGS